MYREGVRYLRGNQSISVNMAHGGYLKRLRWVGKRLPEDAIK